MFSIPTMITFVLLPAIFSILSPAAAQNSTSNSLTTNTSPITTLPASTSYTTTTPVIANISTSTAANGSAIIIASTTTFIIPNPTSAPKVAGEYKLRTKAINGGHARFNHLFLSGWPLINGYYADAAFTNKKSEAAKFYTNGTNEQLDFGTDGKYWALTAGFDTSSTRWFSMTMRSPSGYGYGTYWVNNTGLQWTPNSSPPPHNGTLAALDTYFAGWMACDWWHGVPQLFYKIGGFSPATITPVGCSDVLLLQDFFDN